MQVFPPVNSKAWDIGEKVYRKIGENIVKSEGVIANENGEIINE